MASLLLVAKGASPAITSALLNASPLESLKVSTKGNLLQLSRNASMLCLVALIGAKQRVLPASELSSLRGLMHASTLNLPSCGTRNEAAKAVDGMQRVLCAIAAWPATQAGTALPGTSSLDLYGRRPQF